MRGTMVCYRPVSVSSSLNGDSVSWPIRDSITSKDPDRPTLTFDNWTFWHFDIWHWLLNLDIDIENVWNFALPLALLNIWHLTLGFFSFLHLTLDPLYQGSTSGLLKCISSNFRKNMYKNKILETNFVNVNVVLYCTSFTRLKWHFVGIINFFPWPWWYHDTCIVTIDSVLPNVLCSFVGTMANTNIPDWFV